MLFTETGLGKIRLFILVTMIMVLSGCLFDSTEPILTKSQKINVPNLSGRYFEENSQDNFYRLKKTGGNSYEILLYEREDGKFVAASDKPLNMTVEPLGEDLYVLEMFSSGSEEERQIMLASIKLPEAFLYIAADSSRSGQMEEPAAKFGVTLDKTVIVGYESKEKLFDFFRSLFDSPFVQKTKYIRKK